VAEAAGEAASRTTRGDIARREKELIAATWKEINTKGEGADKAAAMGKTLSEAQANAEAGRHWR